MEECGDLFARLGADAGEQDHQGVVVVGRGAGEVLPIHPEILRGIAIVGALLGFAGYIEGNAMGVDQPQSALDAIRWSASLIPAGLAIVAGILMHRVRPSISAAPKA